jgi:hypothetical protein
VKRADRRIVSGGESLFYLLALPGHFKFEVQRGNFISGVIVRVR